MATNPRSKDSYNYPYPGITFPFWFIVANTLISVISLDFHKSSVKWAKHLCFLKAFLKSKSRTFNLGKLNYLYMFTIGL